MEVLEKVLVRKVPQQFTNNINEIQILMVKIAHTREKRDKAGKESSLNRATNTLQTYLRLKYVSQ